MQDRDPVFDKQDEVMLQAWVAEKVRVLHRHIPRPARGRDDFHDNDGIGSDQAAPGRGRTAIDEGIRLENRGAVDLYTGAIDKGAAGHSCRGDPGVEGIRNHALYMCMLLALGRHGHDFAADELIAPAALSLRPFEEGFGRHGFAFSNCCHISILPHNRVQCLPDSGTALEEGVRVVGFSILSGSHVPLVPGIMERMRKASRRFEDVSVRLKDNAHFHKGKSQERARGFNKTAASG